jgi:hypothetical protein
MRRARAARTGKEMANIPYCPEAINTRGKDEGGSSRRENKLGIVFDSAKLRHRKGEDAVSGEPRYEITKKEYAAVVGSAEEFRKQMFYGTARNGCGQ